MNPPIPTQPCAICGVKTNETQSVIGVAHYKCFTKPRDLPFEFRRQLFEDAAKQEAKNDLG